MRAVEAAGDALYREGRSRREAPVRRRRRTEGAVQLKRLSGRRPSGEPMPWGSWRNELWRQGSGVRSGEIGMDRGRRRRQGNGRCPGRKRDREGARNQNSGPHQRDPGRTVSGDAPCGGRDPRKVEGETGRSELEDGTRVSGETSQRLSCDAGLVRVRHASDGSLLDVGRRTRTIPPALRRALDVRDGGCRFPGCGSRFTEGHHITHWADGGETSLGNCLLLCRHHHRLVHEGGWKVKWLDKGRPVFLDPRGGSHSDGSQWDEGHLDRDRLDRGHSVEGHSGECHLDGDRMPP